MTMFDAVLSGFPYIRIIIAFFLNGFFFLLLTGPIFLECELVKQFPTQQWQSLAGSQSQDGSLRSIILALLALIIGFLINIVTIAISQALRILSDLILNCPNRLTWIRRRVARIIHQEVSSPFRFFTSSDLLDPPIATAFLSNSPLQPQLDWELFNHFFYWGVATNLCIYLTVSLSCGLMDCGIGLPAATLILLLYCCLRSLATGHLIEICRTQTKLTP